MSAINDFCFNSFAYMVHEEWVFFLQAKLKCLRTKCHKFKIGVYLFEKLPMRNVEGRLNCFLKARNCKQRTSDKNRYIKSLNQNLAPGQ